MFVLRVKLSRCWLQQTKHKCFQLNKKQGTTPTYTSYSSGQIYGVALFPGLAFDCLQYAKMEGKGLGDLATAMTLGRQEADTGQCLTKDLKAALSVQGMEAPWSICKAA